MNSSELLKKLIRCYVSTVAAYAGVLHNELTNDNLLCAVNSQRIPREGVLSNGVRYHFHGVGCYIEDGPHHLDFDFGPHDRCDGFDAWRLAEFAKQLPEFGIFHQLETIEAGLEQLLREGWAIGPNWAPSPHLFYRSEQF